MKEFDKLMLIISIIVTKNLCKINIIINNYYCSDCEIKINRSREK